MPARTASYPSFTFSRGWAFIAIILISPLSIIVIALKMELEGGRSERTVRKDIWTGEIKTPFMEVSLALPQDRTTGHANEVSS